MAYIFRILISATMSGHPTTLAISGTEPCPQEHLRNISDVIAQQVRLRSWAKDSVFVCNDNQLAKVRLDYGTTLESFGDKSPVCGLELGRIIELADRHRRSEAPLLIVHDGSQCIRIVYPTISCTGCFRMSSLHCQRCNIIPYCSWSCAREDWPRHSITCRLGGHRGATSDQ